ncbi:thiol reductant ABC exporter subunit CydD [Streptococcus sp. zg-86]|uniref:Thiol reductant ABC exporter subunit CydD n=1 Tax=Streptococcus zhangguiae TaxID=2664091 RepID=A0A6I4RDW1_9STRE|nr:MULTISPECIES: thiol reductant ABC exporter subunit CydD [unclassified Streptococcus]MTB64012.1 thiol reductant ABC exporter subunit CydD [Streptococcus sp. zg-86]MTB90322.1 thiol reductant ABC exporter subunit CydD [Streptococcus sp. zg-36]MWV56000.1 thiol reductant ABC exporter subunit CydD [Streptococcus sp. zg-70]QTH47038.1 thiol reductant ABC exporter subunit CydD [Streptococcus sp. zg-86]
MLDKAVMRLSGVHKLLGLLAGLDILQAIFIIGQAAGLSQAITGVWEGQALNDQLWPILCFLLSYLGRHGINYLKDERLDVFSSQQARLLRENLLQKLFELGPHIVQKEGSGNVITMTLDGISLVENYLHLILNKMMNMSIIPWIILAYICYLDWESGLVLLIVFPIIILFMIILGYAAQARANRQYQQYQLLSNHFLDTLRGIDTLKFFGRSKPYAKNIYQTSENFRKATMSALRIGILSTFALDFFTTLSIAVVAVLLGLRLINGQMLLFPALTILILAPEYFLPVRDFSSDYHATLDGKNAMQSIQQILNTTSIRKEQISMAPWTRDSRLALDQISMAYEDKKLFAGTSLTLTGYQKIGIIGMSGSGKSSLINLLSGFLAPVEGNIWIDQQKVTNLDQEDWRKQLLYIPQNPYVFEMSLRDNITFYTPSASDEEVREAISVVGLDELVASLPEGLDTRIGNGARPLSGGQAQRIALARAFLDKERRILLLDEPTAHLDIETELELKEKMLPLMENRLVLLATHRLHWLHQMDTIWVVDQGQIVEMGSYEELLAKKGKLYHLKTAMGGSHD